MNQQPTREQYQDAYENVTSWPGRAGEPYARLVGAVVDTGGFDMALSPFALATVRVFLGAELAATLGELPRLCSYCEGKGQVDFCTDECACGPVRCATCGGAGVLS